MRKQSKILLMCIASGIFVAGFLVILYMFSKASIDDPTLTNLAIMFVIAISGGTAVSFIPGKIMDLVGITEDEITGEDL
jgi:ABC-type uncharacterized transport system permease subunit